MKTVFLPYSRLFSSTPNNSNLFSISIEGSSYRESTVYQLKPSLCLEFRDWITLLGTLYALQWSSFVTWLWAFKWCLVFYYLYAKRCVIAQMTGCVGHYSNKWFLAWISVVSSGRKPISRKTSTLSRVWDSRRRLKMQNKWLRDRKSPSITCELYDFRRHLTCVQPPPPLRKNQRAGPFSEFFLREGGGCA